MKITRSINTYLITYIEIFLSNVEREFVIFKTKIALALNAPLNNYFNSHLFSPSLFWIYVNFLSGARFI